MVSYLNIWQSILINKSNRPVLQEGEYNLFIRDNIGLYQGKSKIISRQNGRLYLTNKRIIYFDNDNNANCMAIAVSDVNSCEMIEGFLRSSPKVKVHIKSSDLANSSSTESNGNGSSGNNNNKSNDVRIINWACKICSYNNQISTNFDFDENEIPKCTSCGIRPNKLYLIKLLDTSRRNSSDGRDSINESDTLAPSSALSLSTMMTSTTDSATTDDVSITSRRDDQCPTCTFINHPSMKYCELCGSELKSSLPPSLQLKLNESLSNLSTNAKPNTSTDPSSNITNPLKLRLETNNEIYTNNKPYIKISFRKGGEEKFMKHLVEILDDIRWESLKNRGAINQNSVKQPSLITERKQSIKGGPGIHGLELKGEQQRKRNEMILSTSLDDLEQLMFKYQDLIKLSNSFTKFVRREGNINSKYNTSTVVPPLVIRKSSPLFSQELSRHISEYATNFELTKISSMITSQELFSNYNRFLVLTQGFGTELISPEDFNKAIELFDTLKLPIKVKTYEKTGLIVLTTRNSSNSYEEFIIKFMRDFEYEFTYKKLKNKEIGINDDFLQNEYDYFKGVTISEVSDRLIWSYNITVQEIETCIANGSIVIDQSIAGTFYYINQFSSTYKSEIDEDKLIEKIKEEIITEQNTITQDLKDQYDNDNSSNLINVQPDYTFGINRINELMKEDTGASNGSELESFRNTPEPSAQSSQYTSLNDLQGLSFN
ncbi:EAP30/Vps36 family-domain-containing protein [Scheffersomyces coipomensis]|uniref:EAP30/Vps36 family-domain-containing protein n=1 Tax=Scheffersomyces coipomensis TaxID=1788519 RepID=UPI00315D590E